MVARLIGVLNETEVIPLLINAYASRVIRLDGSVTAPRLSDLLVHVLVLLQRAAVPISVTPSGIVTGPTQLALVVTTLLTMVKVPPPEHAGVSVV